MYLYRTSIVQAVKYNVKYEYISLNSSFLHISKGACHELSRYTAFLAIVKYGTISKAADELYISQTAVTRRLKTLEDELGIPLLDRGRGIKEATLTPSGRDFLSIAQRWNAVWEETQRFKSLGERLSLSIGSVQILNDYVFPALYSRLLTIRPA